MDSHWLHQRPGYRCRHGHTSAKPTSPDRPKNLYLREDRILERLIGQLAHLGVPERNPHEIADYLRAHDMTILCDATTCTLEPTTTAAP